MINCTFAPRETNMEYREWREEFNMEDTEELYHSYLSTQANATYEWILKALFPIEN